jgi:hypothetical protein
MNKIKLALTWLEDHTIATIIITVLTIIFLASYLDYQRTLAELKTYREQAEPVLRDVEKVKQEIRENQPKMPAAKLHRTALLIVAGHQLYPDSPLNFKLACIKMETEFNPDVVGPCGEHGLFQIYLPSFGAWYSYRDWGNQTKEFIAGLIHYNECYKVARKACPGDEKERLKLSLTLHNSGYGWRNPFASYGVTRPHQLRMIVLNIWKMIST